MKILNNKQCIKLLKKYNTPNNIFLHSRKVNAVAKFLANQANKKGYNLNLKLIDNASLLHDIEKWNSLVNKTGRHGTEGEKTLINEGLPEAGELVGSHVMHTFFRLNNPSVYKMILFYADMRVTQDKIVSLKNRFDYLLKHYGSESEQEMKFYLQSKGKLFQLEKELLKILNLDPKSINESNIKKYLISGVY